MNIDIKTLLDIYGLPLVILLAITTFIDRRVWPWLRDLISKQLDQSHKLVIEERGKTQEALTAMSKSIDAMTEALLEQQKQTVSALQNMTTEFSRALRESRKGEDSGEDL